MQLLLDKKLVNYEQTGTGKVVLLLHGWGSNSASFLRFMHGLSTDFHCIAPDLPGFGGSAAPGAAWGLTEYAQFVHDFLKKCAVDRPYAVIAHSNGAAVALKAIQLGLLSPDKLEIIGGAGIRTIHKSRKAFLKIIAKTGKPLLFVLPPKIRKSVRKKWYGAIGSEMLLVPGMEETFKRTVGEDMLSAASQVTVPTLLIYGEQDEATPTLYGQLYHEAMPNSTLEIVGQAGHYVFLDAESNVLSLTRDFLK